MTPLGWVEVEAVQDTSSTVVGVVASRVTVGAFAEGPPRLLMLMVTERAESLVWLVPSTVLVALYLTVPL